MSGRYANGAVSEGGSKVSNLSDTLDGSGIRGADNGVEFGVSAYFDKVKVKYDPFRQEWFVDGDLTVSGSSAKAVAEEASPIYSGRFEQGDDIINVAIRFTAVGSGGDIRVRSFSKGEIEALAQEGQQGVGGKMDHGSTTLRLALKTTPDGVLLKWAATAAAHEVGHGLGLHHATDWSGSLMSYDPIRGLNYQDAANLRMQYRDWSKF